MIPPLYKATRPDGTDFKTGTVDYAAALLSGDVVRHPSSTAMVRNRAETYLSVSAEPAETLIGGAWPCRLFRVEAVGNAVGGLNASPHKRAVLSLRVVEELPGWQALGPNGQEVTALIERVGRLTLAEARRIRAARDAGWDAGWDAARYAAWNAAWNAVWRAAGDAARSAAGDAVWDAAWDVTWDAARSAAGNAALATVIRDLIAPEQYGLLMEPWWAGVGQEEMI